jgi:hypothetical protein
MTLVIAYMPCASIIMPSNCRRNRNHPISFITSSLRTTVILVEDTPRNKQDQERTRPISRFIIDNHSPPSNPQKSHATICPALRTSWKLLSLVTNIFNSRVILIRVFHAVLSPAQHIGG